MEHRQTFDKLYEQNTRENFKVGMDMEVDGAC